MPELHLHRHCHECLSDDGCIPRPTLYKKGVVMERTRKSDWLIAQGYRTTTIPPIVTWYLIDKDSGKERELRGRTDDYTLNLYRGKGFVLDRKYLDPQLWNELEYGVKFPGGYANEDRKSLIAVAPQVRYLLRLRELSMIGW